MDVLRQRSAGFLIIAAIPLKPEDDWTNKAFPEFPLFLPSGEKQRYGIVGYGSGWACSKDGVIVTAKHVIEEALVVPNVVFFLAGWADSLMLVSATVLKKAEGDLDLALMKVQPPNGIMPQWIEDADIADTRLEPLDDGTPVFLWQRWLSTPGPLPLVAIFRTGSVGNTSANSSYLFIETQATQGASGSPVFLSNGKIIGLMKGLVLQPNAPQEMQTGLWSIVRGEFIADFVGAR